MKKTLILSTALISIFTLSGCSDTTKKQVQSENSQDSSITKPSKSSEESRSSSTSENTVSSTDAPKEETAQTTSSSFTGYTAEQIEYARVTEAIVHYYKGNYQPVSIEVTKNGQNHQVFPFKGSVVIPQETVTLSFSKDNTMAGTTIVTYSSNHDGSINFYKDPNHYQDERYLKDPVWVKSESQKLLDSMQTLEIPISFDHEAAQIISKIQIK
ncbi:lipoprotein [Lactococcus formosensis subsp. formosensis]|uniref:LptM family lipoprotein n=1 Tax=Lactococcus formosensis TaxID=1281486 RepID=UPI0013FDAEBE